jgi:methane monooxygenase component A beta chain/propane monooxygenase small subunit
MEPELTGQRVFTWFTPARRKPSEYESYTIGLQSDPGQWLHTDWPVRFDDGTPPWSADNSAVRTTRWRDYRDPAQLWQRPFVSHTNQDQQALERILPVLSRTGAAYLAPAWRDEVLARVYAAWPFVEYGLFLALSYGVRQAMSDTVQFPIVFQAADRLRLLQDIVIHLDHLAETDPTFSDAGAREAWMRDPALVGIRELVEHIIASEDWVEALVVTTLVFEPLVGNLAKNELFNVRAAQAGDSATPTVVAGALRDTDRHIAGVAALVRLLCSDPEYGAENSGVIAGWIADWGKRADGAAVAFLGAFTAAGVDESTARAALARSVQRQREALDEAGMSA